MYYKIVDIDRIIHKQKKKSIIVLRKSMVQGYSSFFDSSPYSS